MDLQAVVKTHILPRRRLVGAPVLSALSMAFGLSGCASTDTGDPAQASGNILIANEHNYSSQSSLSIPSVDTAPAADLDICWTDVVNDIQCHELAPQADVDSVGMLRLLHLSEAEAEARLTSDELSESEIAGFLSYETDHQSTCTRLSALTLFGTQVDLEDQYVESDDYTYMLLFSEGTTPGVGARSMMFLHPTSTSTNTTVNAQAGCGFLDFSANLSSEALAVPARGPWVVDWRAVTENGQGNPINFGSIDGLLLGFYEGMSVADIEAQILDLELIATTLWEAELSGARTANLGTARERGSGAPFTGFERDTAGVWLLGLMCSACQNPAPVVLAVLEVLEPSAGGY